MNSNTRPDPTMPADAQGAIDARLEALSSLVDAELDPRAADELIGTLCRDTSLRAHWSAYHAVGDALRSSEVAATHAPAFCDRVRAALAQEPAILAPRALKRRSPVRRLLAPTLAVAASVAVIGFVAVPLMRPDEAPSAPQPALLAQQPAVPVTTAAAPQQPAPNVATAAAEAGARRTVTAAQRTRALDAYLVAHRELMGGVALPRATPYLRTAGDLPEGR